MNAWVYVLRLNSGKLYVGSTGMLLARIEQHLNARGSNETRSDAPKECVAFYPCMSRAQAYTLEAYLQHQQKYVHAWIPPSVKCGADVQRLHLLADNYKQKQLAWREAYYAARNVPRRKVQIVRGPVRLTTREIAATALDKFIQSLSHTHK